MRVRAATLLGDNTIGPLEALAARLRSGGLNVDVDVDPDWTTRQIRLENGDLDLVWACGLLTRKLVAEGCELSLVGVPLLEGETGPVYRSVIVRPIDAMTPPGPGRLAVNDFGSWSGWHGYISDLASSGRPSATEWSDLIETGSHLGSLRAVADGRADLASVDVSVWRHVPPYDRLRTRLRVVRTTVDWPSPPLTMRAGLPAPVREQIGGVIDQDPRIVSGSLADYDHMLSEAGRTDRRIGAGTGTGTEGPPT